MLRLISEIAFATMAPPAFIVACAVVDPGAVGQVARAAFTMIMGV
jgi:hypothetical protein